MVEKGSADDSMGHVTRSNPPLAPILVMVDVQYRPAPEGGGGVADPTLASARGFDLEVEGQTRAEASRHIVNVLQEKVREWQGRGELEDRLRKAGLYPASPTEWTPRISGGDERVYIHATGASSCS